MPKAMAPKAKSTTGAKHKPFNMRTKSGSSANPMRSTEGVRQRGGNLRDKATIKRLNMYKGGKAIRNKEGKIIGGTYMMPDRSGDAPLTAQTGRVQPDRRWFGNTRVIGQTDLDKFREQMTQKAADPYNVVLRRRKLPMGLLQESEGKVKRMNLLETETFDSVFAGKRSRKRPKLAQGGLEGILERAQKGAEEYGEGEKDLDRAGQADAGFRDERRNSLFDKGQSRRIWGELYKVLDCSDVVLQILDARNVPGTRCPHLEKHLKKNAPHKHLVFIINKVDLVPNWVTKKWVRELGKEYPTLAFHASINNSFGKGALINLLRQFSKLHSDKKQISVGVVGYPNVGKSSVINTLRKKKVCNVAPVPGETKVWQYIALMRRLFIIDCPGVVYETGDDETEIVLKGVVRAERLPDPSEFVGPILERANPDHLFKVYGVGKWEDPVDFMTLVARRSGRLLKGGEPDLQCIAVNMINDWQRGKIPWYIPPDLGEGETPESIARQPNDRVVVDKKGKMVHCPAGKEPSNSDSDANSEADAAHDDDSEASEGSGQEEDEADGNSEEGAHEDEGEEGGESLLQVEDSNLAWGDDDDDE
jgi:nuclear GTP-binding protein